MLDPRPRGEMNAMVMESMLTTSWKFWAIAALMALIVAVGLFGAWGYMISEGLYVATVNRPMYWSYFLVHTVFWIGISHAGTFVSALLRVFKAEFRRPFTRAAELMTTFGLVQAGIHIFAHMGRVWLTYWMFPFPNQRQLWTNFHSPLMWDFLAINTYLLSSTMYLFLPLIPDLAMARDRSTGWRKTFYRILASAGAAPKQNGRICGLRSISLPLPFCRSCSQCTPSSRGILRRRCVPAGVQPSLGRTSSSARCNRVSRRWRWSSSPCATR